MPDLAIPLAAATAFTAGGYAILKMERQAEVVGEFLFTVFVLVTLATGAVALNAKFDLLHPRRRLVAIEPATPQMATLATFD